MKNSPQIKNKVQFDPFSGPQIESVIHTTKSQSEILIDCDFGGDDAKRAYNLSFSLNFLGDFKFNALERAIEHLVERHESLRASFSEDGEFMSIFSEIAYEISYNDISNKLEDEKLKLKDALQHQDINYLFDLVNGPLFKASVIKLNENAHIFNITVHHSICDGLSIDVFLEELGILYSAYVQDKLPNLPEVNPYSLFAEKENLFAESNEYKLSEDFWLNMYQESVPKVELPIDYPRPQIRTYNNHRLDFLIDNNLLNALKHTGINAGCSLVTTLMAAFEVFLYQQTGQNDLVVGLTNSRPVHFDMTQIIGHGVNVLPLRSKVDSKITFNDYLTIRKSQFFDAYEHQSISFGHILEKLSVTRDLSRIPLVPVTLNLELNKNLESEISFHNLSHDLTLNIGDYGTFEIELQAFQSKDGPCIRWKYNTTLFKPETIEQMMASFKEVLNGIVANPNVKIGDFIKVDDSAYLELNDTDASSPNSMFEETNFLNNEDFLDYAEGKNIVDLFLSQVKKIPNNISVAFGQKNITYKELDDLSNQFSNYLINSHDVKVNDLISVMLERSEWIIVVAIGILKSGAAYVPIEPKYPEKRKNYIIEDSECKIIIDNRFITDFINKIDEFSPKLNDSIKILPESLCYVIYTSGTTGNPKGVMVEHRNVVSLLYNGENLFNFNENDIWCMFHSFCFDFSVWEMYGSLLFGGKLIIVPELIAKDPFEFISMIEKEGITVLNQTPSAFINLVESTNSLDVSLNLRYIIFGGEALFPKHLKKWYIKYPEVKFINMYGITETTVHVTYKEIDKYAIDSNISTIGNCIPTLTAYILDEFKNPQPEGVVGELYVAGKGVARGYLNRPELTKERFLPNIFKKGERMYRSGDLAKWLPNGEIEFVGRNDDQVKIRGHRIEIREVEAALSSLSNIRRSVVITSNHLAGELSLVAYLQPIDTEDNLNTVRDQLKEILPEFQIPSTFMLVEKFSLTTNGKIDKTKLPSPEYVRPDSRTDLNIAQTKLEKDIANIWSEFLQIPVIDIGDNFFEMGGSSLIAQRVIGSLRKKLNIEIPLIKIFQYPTISQLAESLGENLKVEDESKTISKVQNAKVTASIGNLNPEVQHTNIVLKKKTELVINTTKAQSEILTDCLFGGDDAKRAYNISLSLKFVGKLKYNALELAIQSLVERHESLRSSFSEDLNFMHIYTDFHVDILYHDISNQGETEKQKSKKSLINDDVNYLFDLVNGPLLKFNLVKINEDEHELILLVNHAVCDGLSTSIILEELGVLYSAFCQDKLPTLNEPDSFSLFADKENKFAESDAYKRSVEFWLNMYQESIPKLELPIDYPRPELRSYNGNYLDCVIDDSLLNALKQIGNSSESGMFTSIVTTLVAAFEVFLYQQTGQNDLVLGLISSTRANYDMMQMVGHSVNLLPLRSKVDTKISFKDYLTQRSTQLFDAYEHQSISFGHLLEKLSIPRDPSRVPLVPVIINIQLDDVLESKNSFFDLSTEIKYNENNYRTFEIELQVIMSNEGPRFRWRYNTTLFKPETIEQMMASFKEVLNGIVANPSIKIGDFIKVDDSAYLELNDTLVSYPQLPLHQLIMEEAENYGQKNAILFGEEEISYTHLSQQVNRLSQKLIEIGVEQGDVIGVALPRSTELVVTLLAIMQCGAAYLPLDTNYPQKRLEYMLSDSGANFLITSKDFSKSLETDSLLLFIEDLFLNLIEYAVSPISITIKNNQTAYILYTSGSTGKPKGVPITHKSFVNFLYSMSKKPGITQMDKLLSITTISFDIAGLELFLPLLTGATLVLANDDMAKDGRLLLDYIKDESITMLQATPTTWQMLLDSGWVDSLPIKALCGGEMLPVALSKKILTKVNELWNMYGPTETTIWSTTKQILKDDKDLTIGKPIDNTQIYILNEQRLLMPSGAVGEIVIGGDGVSNGYWKREALSSEKFITNPFASDSKLYRTGDLGKLLLSGEIQCLGRMDDQVKIRGHRIELGEIEEVLNTMEGVKSSLVMIKDDRLIAFVIEKTFNNIEQDNEQKWKIELAKHLPNYMIPHSINIINEFPKTLNGKIDRQSLLKNLFTSSNNDSNAYTGPRTNTEQIVADIWEKCLHIEKISVFSDFFELGGHSLTSVRVMSLIEKETGYRLPLLKIFQYPTISQLAEFLGENLKVEDESKTISKVQNAKVTASIGNLNPEVQHTNIVLKKKTELVINTTKAQSEILTDCLFGGDDAKRAYNISLSLKFVGKLKYNALELAIQSLVERHESLRSSFSEDLNFMHIYTDFHVDILYHDISNQGETEKQKSKKSLINDDVNYLFDLVNGPLLKFNLVKINEDEHELILLVNHAVCDGLSTSIILEELGVLYSAFCQDKLPTLNEPDSFSLFADKENKFAESDAYKRSVEFWLNMYQESIPKLELPIDYPRPELRTYNNHHLDFLIDNSLLNALKQIGNSGESSVFTSIVTTLVAAFEVFLYKETGQNDLVLGLTSSRRANYDMMQMIGHSVNLLPLRSKIDSKIGFIDYLIQRSTQLFDAYEHQSISFGHLLRKLSVPRDVSRVPLVPVIINIQLDDVLENKNSFFDLTTDIIYNENNYRTFEIEIQVFMSNEGPCFRWRYNTTLFRPETIERMMASFKEVLNSIVANPNVEIGKTIQIDNSAYLNLNDTSASYPQLPLHELIAQQCKVDPSKKAIKFGESEISYENLEKQVHQIAHYLKQQGVRPGDFVAVSLPRSIELITILLAIMESGAAYLPLDPNYPSKRLEFMLEDSGSKYLITTESSSLNLNPNVSQLFVESIFSGLSKYSNTALNIEVHNNQVAYILYTSGSTGKPKGVTVTHKNLVNLLYSVLKRPGILKTDKVISITTVSFDIAGFELYTSLLKGAQLILTNEETSKDPRLLLEVLKTEEITVMEATPATWQMLLDTGWKNHLPLKAFCTGEALPMVLAKNILNKVDELWNLYGPTETTIWSSIKKIDKTDDVVTIGSPIANTQLYIMNEQGLLVEPGRIGELCIAGDGVAQGYWKRSELTNEKFIKNPFETELGPVLYRTGDLAKLLPSGEVQCLGRIDQQIKIRGQRVELGEIEEAIDSLEGVQSSVVLLNEDRLVANLITSDINNQDSNRISAWKAILKEQLPKHMIPQIFNLVKEFPQTLNGKIDRKALSKLLPSDEPKKTGITEPSTPSEKIIASIWQDCLNLDRIDIHSDFFELGGHSLIAVRVMLLLEEEIGKRLPLAALMTYSTIEKLAQLIDEEDHKSINWDSLVPIQPNGTKTPLFMVHGAEHNVLFINPLVKFMDGNQPIYGLQAKGLNGIDTPHDTIEDIAAHYISEIIKINPNGPYALGGYSFGGIVAFEMARQLQAENKEVKTIILLDSYVFPIYFQDNLFKKRIAYTKYMIEKIIFMTRKMFRNKTNFNQRVSLIKKSFYHMYLLLKYGKEKQHKLIHSWPLILDQKLSTAIRNYHIKPLEIEVNLLKVKEDDVFYAHDPKYLGWDKIAKGGVNRHIIPGNHKNLFSSPNVEVLAKTIQDLLDNSD